MGGQSHFKVTDITTFSDIGKRYQKINVYIQINLFYSLY